MGNRTKAAVVREIRADWPAILERSGVRHCTLPAAVNLLGSGTKTAKGEAERYLTAVVYMAPANSAFIDPNRTLCPWATAQCAATCLGEHSGRMPMQSCSNARLWKTALYMGARELFGELIDLEISAFTAHAQSIGYTPCIRVDGSTDTGYGAIVAARHPSVQFYDYTKSVARALKRHAANYHVTFSFSGANREDALRVLASGGNVAVVFDTPKGAQLPATWEGYELIDGDVTDLRFTDPKGTVCGLRFKQAKNRSAAIERAGNFVVRVHNLLRLAA